MKASPNRRTAVVNKINKMQSLSALVSESAFCVMAGESKAPLLTAPDELGITFIGHSSFLLQIAGRKLLLDPVFAMRLIALRRMRRPGIRSRICPQSIWFCFRTHIWITLTGRLCAGSCAIPSD